MKYIINIVIATFIAVAVWLGMYLYFPVSIFDGVFQNFGSTITTIAGSDTLSASRSVINTNFSNLNTDKLENGFSVSNASSSKFSALQAWFGATATSTFSAAGVLSLITPLAVSSGGTGLSTFTGSNRILYTSDATTVASEAAFTYDQSVNRLTADYASSTASSFSSSLIGTRANLTGAVSPIHNLSLFTGTTTTWTASTTNSTYSPVTVAPFSGTIKSVQCIPFIGSSAGSFIGVNVKVNGSNITPSYFIASSTVGTITFSAGNTFTKGQTIIANFGTTTTATATSVSCTFLVTETP